MFCRYIHTETGYIYGLKMKISGREEVLTDAQDGVLRNKDSGTAPPSEDRHDDCPPWCLKNKRVIAYVKNI